MATGRRAGLAADGGPIDLVVRPDLTGTVRGRRVRARTIGRLWASGFSERSDGTVPFTVVEAHLSDQVEDGVLIQRERDLYSPDRSDAAEGSLSTTPIGGDLSVVGGGSTDLAEAALTPQIRDVLDELDDMGVLTLGDPSESLFDDLPDTSESAVVDAVTRSMTSAIQFDFTGDSATVAIEDRGVLIDAVVVERRATAVALLAESLEDAVREVRRA